MSGEQLLSESKCLESKYQWGASVVRANVRGATVARATVARATVWGAPFVLPFNIRHKKLVCWLYNKKDQNVYDSLGCKLYKKYQMKSNPNGKINNYFVFVFKKSF
jgi:hypothetical protein